MTVAGAPSAWPRRALLLVLLVIAASPAAYFVYDRRLSPRARAIRLRVQARLELSLGRAREAALALERAVALAPGSAEARRELGEAYLAAGARAPARQAFEAATALDPGAIEPRIRLATLALDERDLGRARAEIDWLSAPERSARVRALGDAVPLLAWRAAWLAGDERAAAAAADQALDLAPRSPRALAARAAAALASGDAALARDLIERVGRDAAREPALALLLSRAREEAGDLAGARAALDDAVAAASAAGGGAVLLAADREALAVRRAEIAAALGDAAAIDAVRASLPPSASAAARDYLAGLAAVARGDLAAAEEALRRAATGPAGIVAARLELAKVLVARGETGRARLELGAVLERDPLSRPARLQLARALALEGRHADAAREAESLLSGGARDAEAARLLVMARAREGRPEEARRFFAALEAKDPANEAAAFGRSLAALAALDADAALEGGDRLLAESPTARGALELLAAAHAARRGLAAALDRVRLLVASDARLAPARLQVARAYAALGRLDLAEAELRGAIEADPGGADVAAARLALASIADLRGDPRAAAAEAEAVLAIRPDDLAARALLARALLASGDAAGALALAEAPRGAAAVTARARAHALALARTGLAAAVELGDIEGAERRFEAARALDPTLPRAILEAARLALGGDGDAEGALAALASKDERFALARGLLDVDAALLRGDAQAARAAAAATGTSLPYPLRRALLDRASVAAATPSVRATGALARRLVLAAAYGFRAPARALAAAVERDHAGDVFLGLVAWRALEDLGLRDEARTALERLAGRHPDAPAALGARGAMLLDRGEPAAAAAPLRRLVALAPEEPWAQAFLGLALEGAGAPADALEAYREAARLDPTSALVRTRLARLLAKDEGSIEQALAHATEAVRLAPKNAAALEALGLAQLSGGAPSEAVAALRSARDAAPREPRVRYHLARAYLRLGLTELALAELEMAVLLGPETEVGLAAAALRDRVLSSEGGSGRPGSTPAAAAPLGRGGEAGDSLGPRGARHYWRFDVAGARETLVLRYKGPRDAATGIAIARQEERGPRELKKAAVPPGRAIAWELSLAKGIYAVEVAAAATSIAPYGLAVAAAPEGRAAPPGGDRDREREPNDALPDATPLPLGVPLAAGLGPYRDRDVFLFPAAPGDRVDLRVTAPEGAPLAARLCEPSDLAARPAKVFAVEGGTSVEVRSIRLGPRGLALEVEGEGDATGLAYEVTVRPAAPAATAPPEPPILDEPDDLPSAAQALAPAAGARRGTIEPAGDRDLLRLPEGRSALTIRAPWDLDLAIEALLPTGAEPRVARAIEIGRGKERCIPSLGAPGLLLAIRAARPGGASSSPYDLAWEPVTRPAADVEPNDDLESAAVIGDAPIEGLLDAPADRDVYRLPAAAAPAYSVTATASGRPIVIAFLTAPPGAAPRVPRRIAVRPGQPLVIAQWTPGAGPGGLEVARPDDGAGAATAAADEAGPPAYALRIVPRAPSATLETEPNEDPPGACALALGSTIEGVLDSADDRDVFGIDAPADLAAIRLALEPLEGPRPAVAVIDGAPGLTRRRTVEAARAGNARIAIEAVAGRFYVAIEPAPGAPAGTLPTRYRLAVAADAAPPPSPAGPGSR